MLSTSYLPKRNPWWKQGVGLLFLIFSLRVGISQDETSLYQSSSGTIHFVSDAPLELIEATSESLLGLIDVEKRTFAFSVAMNSFRGFNSLLQQEHYNEKYLDTDRYTHAKFSGKIIENISVDLAEFQEVRAKGVLNIHGVSQERIIKGKLRVTDNMLKIEVDFSVPLADHDIQIPKVVYQKIAEHIKVHVEISMEHK